MDYKKLKEVKAKVKGGNKGLLPTYLDLLLTESLEKLQTCLPADLQYHQSRYAVVSEIKNLLG